MIILGSAGAVWAETADESADNPFAAMDAAYEESLYLATGPGGHVRTQSAEDLTERRQQAEALTADPGTPYIVRFTDEADLQQIFDVVKLYNYKLLGRSEQRTFMIKISDLEAFQQQAADIVDSLEEDQIRTVSAVPSDPEYSNQWALPVLHLPEAWDFSTGSESVMVAVIDSGLDRTHPDFAGVNVCAGWDYTAFPETTCTTDGYGHGTAVTGVIAAQTDNGIGIAGVNWDVTIVPLKIINSEGDGYLSDEILAIYSAADSGCKVINLSLGGYGSDDNERAAVEYALSMGCIIVASAGNDGNSDYAYPASYDGVISVGAVFDNAGVISWSDFSQHNDAVDAAAPGEHIYITASFPGYPDDDYLYKDGTSFSAPYVSGIAALAAACEPDVTPAEFEAALEVSCDDLGDEGYDEYYGWGLINAQKMLRCFVTLDSIEITNPADKLTYYLGDELDITGLTVSATYSSGVTLPVDITTDNITGFDSSAADDSQILTITVEDKTATYEVQILQDLTTAAAALTGLSVKAGADGAGQELIKNFGADKLCYSLTLLNATEAVCVTAAAAADTNAKVIFNEAVVPDGVVALAEGENIIRIVVSEESKEDRIYTVKINRLGIDECFIATAAYGSKFELPVVLLRNFRDQFLLTNAWGKSFVSFYYHNSPPVAAVIAANPALKIMTRLMLAPVVAVVFTIFHPAILAAFFILLLLYFRLRVRRLPVRGEE